MIKNLDFVYNSLPFVQSCADDIDVCVEETTVTIVAWGMHDWTLDESLGTEWCEDYAS